MPTWIPEVRARGAAAALALAALAWTLPGPVLQAAEAALDVEGFTLRITDESGTITHVLQGERMQQFDALGYQRTDMPRLELLLDGAVDWIWTAPLALHYPVEHRLELLGPTEGLRLPSPRHARTTIETADVTIFTQNQLVVTETRATQIQPGLFMTGIGMHADLAADTIELHSDVRTVYASEQSREPR